MVTRAQKLSAAFFLALAFLGLSLVYGLIAGTLGGSTVLFVIPELEFGGPLGQITLFGEVSTQGLIRATLGALPAALAILLFGILSSVLQPRHFFRLAQKFNFARSFFSKIAVLMAVIPNVLTARKEITKARGIRGENSGRLLLPVLRSLRAKSRVIGLRFALLPTRTACQSDTALEFEAVEIEGLNLGAIEIRIETGELVVLTGPTGSGKSSLLEASRGLTTGHQKRRVTGKISVFGVEVNKNLAELSSMVSLVPQDPRAYFLGERVSDELCDVTEHYLGSKKLMILPLGALSQGEAVVVAITRALNPMPKLLLIDEPFAALDSLASKDLIDLIEGLIQKGVTIMVAEHRIEGLLGLHPRLLRLDGHLEEGPWSPRHITPELNVTQLNQHKVLRVFFDQLTRGTKLLGETDFSVYQGEILAVSGPNGSGKTSLLEAISKGPVLRDIYGVRLDSLAKPDSIALVPDSVADFFSAKTLADELTRADQLAKVLPGFTKNTFASLLLGSELTPELLSTHPNKLSFGTKLTLAISMQLSHKPKVLLLDEPVKGFDSVMRANAAKVLRLVVQTGTAIILSSQDAAFIADSSDRELVIQNQMLVQRVAGD